MKALLCAACVGFTTASTPIDAAEPTVPTWQAVEVDNAVGIGYGVAVADVDGDRAADLLLVDRDRVVWYANPTWEKRRLTGKLTAHDHVCIAAADTDGDGRCEVAVGAEWNPSNTTGSGAVFHLNAPADRRQAWQPARLPHEPTVHRMRWVRNREGGFDLVVVPLHGRGNDPRSGEGAGVQILAYRPPANSQGGWITEVLDRSLHKTHNFEVVQWDADPEEELLVASREGVFLLDRGATATRRVPLASDVGGGAGEVRAGRLGRGPRFVATIQPMHGTNLVVYLEREHSDGVITWERSVLDSALSEGHALGTGDFLALGGDQIVVGWRGRNPPATQFGIKLFYPLDGQGQRWGESWVDSDGMACEDLAVADVDADGRLDLVAAGRATKNLKVYFNRSHRPQRGP